jgi:hypothetical protein
MSEFPHEKLTHVIDCVTDLHEYQIETHEEEEKSTQKIVLVTGGAGKRDVADRSSPPFVATPHLPIDSLHYAEKFLHIV